MKGGFKSGTVREAYAFVRGASFVAGTTDHPAMVILLALLEDLPGTADDPISLEMLNDLTMLAYSYAEQGTSVEQVRANSAMFNAGCDVPPKLLMQVST